MWSKRKDKPIPRKNHDKNAEASTLKGRAARYAKVAGSAVRVGAGVARQKLTGDAASESAHNAALIRAALGGLKGPLMKVAQLLAAIPDFLPPEYAAEFATLQADAPSMGWPFVRRRMAGELGPDWQNKFKSFEQEAAAAASLGQVHRAVAKDGRKLACKLQYPDMKSVIDADLQQLKILLSLFERFDGAVTTDEVFEELTERLHEELDYGHEAKNMALYAEMLHEVPCAHVPRAIPELSTPRLLTMEWMDGQRLLDAAASRSQEERNQIAMNMFNIWYAPFYHYGVIHGDPHMGNYTIRPDCSINLMDFGCVRVFRPELVQAVIMMFKALRDKNEAQAIEAYRLWGFENLSKDVIDILHDWAKFIYAPLMEDRVMSVGETNATSRGREVAGRVHRALRKAGGGLAIPREFVMIDRASIGLGGVFLRLSAEVNWFRLYNNLVEDFDLDQLKRRQNKLLGCSNPIV